MPNDIVLAIDLGGTNLRMAAVGADGTIFANARTKTPKNNGPAGLLDAIGKLADECRVALNADQKVVGFGAGIPANIVNGPISGLPNFREIEGMNLGSELEAKFGVPAVLENDATAAAIGENWLGASKDVRDSVMITLGTGVGGGIIINNEPLRGIDGTAGKLGHICVEPDGHPCKCGSRGCIEQYASATAIERMASEAGLDVTTSFEVYKLAQSGDAVAREVFQKMGRYLGITLAGLANALNPEMIVIGGGAASSWDAFIDSLTAELHHRAFKEPAARVQIVRGKLEDDAGILGAARSAFLSL
ncbi:MAG: ROK family protein [Pyrinomonadaceae bacterium]